MSRVSRTFQTSRQLMSRSQSARPGVQRVSANVQSCRRSSYQHLPGSRIKTNSRGGIAEQPYQNLRALLPEAIMYPGMMLAGAWVAKTVANLLEESDIFVFEDDD